MYIDETWIDTGYSVKFCWQSKENSGVYQAISKDESMQGDEGICTECIGSLECYVKQR